MSGPRVLLLTAVALLTSVVLTGCGGSEVDPSADAGNNTSAVPTVPTVPAASELADPLGTGSGVKLEKPKARETIEPSASMTAVPGTGTIYSRKDARTIQGFPVPKGSKVKDPGAIEETWQFDIATKDPDEVLEFYEQVLPQMGFRVRTDVTYTQGYEEVHWDLVFDGRYSGSMVADPVNETIFVVVNPPGQPAFAGDEG